MQQQKDSNHLENLHPNFDLVQEEIPKWMSIAELAAEKLVEALNERNNTGNNNNNQKVSVKEVLLQANIEFKDVNFDEENEDFVDPNQ